MLSNFWRTLDTRSWSNSPRAGIEYCGVTSETRLDSEHSERCEGQLLPVLEQKESTYLSCQGFLNILQHCHTQLPALLEMHLLEHQQGPVILEGG
mmetsp:Transcript_74324/g.129931  ORF Transcript_74324/g.129931 Transcript_74324/m.129931 type:complete len:95 (-) Transcript_74324:12-296(-)